MEIEASAMPLIGDGAYCGALLSFVPVAPSADVEGQLLVVPDGAT